MKLMNSFSMRSASGCWRLGRVIAAVLSVATIRPAVADPISVTTYHNDNLRTGWNASETTLTPAAIKSGQFGRLGVVALDEQVDAEPLYMPNIQIPSVGAKNVVYVATEHNTVYAIDADAGTVLESRNLGQSVPRKATPGGCSNSSSRVGIDSTPVIDAATNTLYVITYGFDDKKPVYRIHALALDTLADKVPAVVVSATQPLTDNTPFSFNAPKIRLRAGLVEANGNIYAAFTSFCDFNADTARGWVLGWQADTLAPLTAGKLLNRLATAPGNYFLSTVWMSGSGIAADNSGNLYFNTGNSATSGTPYGAGTNLAESVVKLSPDLTTVQGYFTPSGAAAMDQNDKDFGSGGIMLLPAQPGIAAELAVAAGKQGFMYLLDRDNLGGYTAGGPDNVIGTYQIGRCWCSESYYQGADGIGRIVTSGGTNVIVWKVHSGATPTLTQESISASLPIGQDSGFFTSISSNGTQAVSQIVWAVTRPTRSVKPAPVYLYAINPSFITGSGQSSTLFTAVAGTWPHTFANSNIVPLVANGRVYVASYKKLVIFGLGASPAVTASVAELDTDDDTVDDAPLGNDHVLIGNVISIDSATVKLRTRTGRLVTVETVAAKKAHLAVTVSRGEALMVHGVYDKRGVMHAETIMRAKDSPALWPADR
jgi:hypothetical protein